LLPVGKGAILQPPFTGAMTDEAFLGYFVGGLDILGHRVTARIGKLHPDQGVPATESFIITVDHRDEIPLEFAPDEPLASRMAKVDAAVERWRILR
jgi:hypothetical protein